MKIDKNIQAVTLALAALVVGAAPAAAQNFPQKPVRTVIGYTPGGTTDVVARIIGQKLTELWGQPVIVDSRPGAAGNIGAENVARSPADGYSMLLGQNALAVSPAMYTKMAYDVQRDLATVTSASITPHVILLHPSLPARNVKELIALAKKKPNEFLMASTGHGNSDHMVAELFNTMAGIKMVHIPYKGGAPAMADLLAGQVQLMFDNLANALPQVKAGKLRALAVTTAQRSAFAPDLPTLAEAGVPGFDLTTWFGIFLPGNAPRDIVLRLNTEINKALNAPDMKDRLEKMGAEPPANNTPERFAAFIKVEFDKYARVIKASGAKVE